MRTGWQQKKSRGGGLLQNLHSWSQHVCKDKPKGAKSSRYTSPDGFLGAWLSSTGITWGHYRAKKDQKHRFWKHPCMCLMKGSMHSQWNEKWELIPQLIWQPHRKRTTTIMLSSSHEEHSRLWHMSWIWDHDPRNTIGHFIASWVLTFNKQLWPHRRYHQPWGLSCAVHDSAVGHRERRNQPQQWQKQINLSWSLVLINTCSCGSKGLGPPCPQDFFLNHAVSGNFKGKAPILSKFWA